MMELPELDDFLGCSTPDAWIREALLNQDALLIDHANCEKKAAQTALALMFRYPGNTDLQWKMSRLAREELRHFEQVLEFIRKREVAYVGLSASRYAALLREHISQKEPQRFIDLMVVGAFIEARSCERFSAIAPFLDQELARFYVGLLNSEKRHFQDYLKLALASVDDESKVWERVSFFKEVESDAISSVDSGPLRFHSGFPEKVAEETSHIQEGI